MCCKKELWILGAVLAAVSWTPTTALAGGGGNCASATVITLAQMQGGGYHDTGNFDGDDDCSGRPYNEVFYQYDCVCTGSYTFDMCNSTGDSYLRIVSAACCPGTLVVTSDDVCTGDDPQVTVTLTAGTTYWFHCGTYGSTSNTAAYYFNAVTTCTLATGACCFADGTCQELLSGNCAAQGGLFQGAGTTCSPNPCTPFCWHQICLVDSYGDGWNGGKVTVYVDGTPRLTDVTLASGYGPVCYSFPAATGATIFADYTAGSWSYENGYYVYDGSGVAICSYPPGPPLDCTAMANCEVAQPGACCFGDGHCEFLMPGDCTTAGGVYQGAAVPCVPNPCPQPPPNDLCENAQLIAGPYPQTVSGTNINATLDCPGVLNWNAVWYEVQLPNALNNVSVRYCGTSAGIGTTGIVYLDSCAGCATYHVATYAWNACSVGGASGVDMAWSNVPGPASIWIPAYFAPAITFDATFDVTNAGPPTGACCFTDGSCLPDMSESDCTTAGGTYWGTGTTCTPNPCPQPPPPNDDCTTALALSVPGSVIANNSSASVDVTPLCGTSTPYKGLWYTVVGTGNTITLTTCSTNTTFDTKIQVFCDCPAATCVAGNDDAACAYSSLHSTVTFCSVVDHVYYVIVGGYGTNTGTFELIATDDGTGCTATVCVPPPTGACCVDYVCMATNLQSECTALGGTWFVGETCPGFACPLPPPGDVCATAWEIPSLPATVTGSTVGFSNDYDEVCPYSGSTSPDVVYWIDSFFDVFVTIDLCASSYDTKVYVYQDTCVSPPIACNDDYCPGYRSYLECVPMPAGHRYYIVVDGYGGSAGDYVMTLTRCILPGADCWVTECGATQSNFTETPIPAGFFDPGSDPFDGIIMLGGGGGLPDTVVQRMGPLYLPEPWPSTDTVPIEIVALNLVSCAPITVTHPSGPPELWNVQVGLSPTPAPQGTLTVTKTHANGGTFTATFFVQPLYTFTRVNPPHDVRVLDTGGMLPPIPMQTVGTPPWSTDDSFAQPPCTSDGFAPGYNGTCGEEVCHSSFGTAPHVHCTRPPQCPPCPEGACCIGTTCQMMSQAACAASNGVFLGPGSDCFPNPCAPPPHYWLNLQGGTPVEQGGNGTPPEWVYYPSGWWNMWWPNDYALNREKLVTLVFDIQFTGAPPIVAFNYSVPTWMEPNPPLPPLDDQIIRVPVDPPVTAPGTYTYTTILPICPAWVSIDVLGDNFQIQGTIEHVCLPECATHSDCDDGDPCTIDECVGGNCVHTPVVCDDGNPCTVDWCDPVTGECHHDAVNCDDNNACTNDWCDPVTGECHHDLVICDDNDPCTDNACDPQLGCVYTPIVCDDGDPCTTDECVNGVCVYTPIVCDDGDPCTVDYCDNGDCVHTQVCGACCYPDGHCEWLNHVDCSTTGGTWFAGVPCDPNPCPQPLGACCFADGHCEQLTEHDCVIAGGTDWFPNTPCDPNPCPQPTGACCFCTGLCQVALPHDCATAGGVFMGTGTDCDPNPCPQPTNPRLTLEADDDCYQVGETLTVDVWMHDIADPIVGAQFFLSYDAVHLMLQAGPGAITPGDPPMSVQVFECSTAEQTNPQCPPGGVLGQIDYAVGVPTPPGDEFVVCDHKLAVLHFTVIGEICNVAGFVNFRSNPPFQTRLSKADATPLYVALYDLPPMSFDSTPPTFSGCDDITVPNDPNLCSALVTWPDPTAMDNCVGPVSAVQTGGPPSGSVFPVGSTDITYSAIDDCGNVATCTFTVTVTDTQPPVASCPADVTVPNDPDLCSAVVTFAATVSDNCPGATIDCVPPSGSTFPVGTTTVTCTATDAAGNSDTCTFTVTVEDTQPPVASCPADISVGTDPGECSAVVSWTATVSDNCPNATIACSPPSGSIFPVGTTLVTCTATDASGNTDTCTFAVTVSDTENPVANCPGDFTVPNDPGQCGAVISFTATVSDNCPGATIDCVPSSGSFFPVGTTTVICWAQDAAGNPDICSFTITVNDTEPPVPDCPDDITVYPDPGGCTAVVTWVATASDNCPGATIACNPPSGSTFSGVTTVTCTATDASGNTATCTFTVTVLGINSAQATLELQGPIQQNVVRCVRLTFRNCPTGVPEVRDVDVVFPANALGNSIAIVLLNDLPCGDYDCATAEDELHTLTSRVTPTIVGGQYVADFTGADLLYQADQYDDNLVDILDFGVFVTEWGWFGDPNTPCGDTFPKSDMDASGALDAQDFGFVASNFLMIGDPDCCAAPLALRGPRSSITVTQLQSMGLGHLAIADLTGDGVLDVADMEAFANGVRPLRPGDVETGETQSQNAALD